MPLCLVAVQQVPRWIKKQKRHAAGVLRQPAATATVKVEKLARIQAVRSTCQLRYHCHTWVMAGIPTAGLLSRTVKLSASLSWSLLMSVPTSKTRPGAERAPAPNAVAEAPRAGFDEGVLHVHRSRPDGIPRNSHVGQLLRSLQSMLP